MRTDRAFAPDPVEELALQKATAKVRALLRSEKASADEPAIIRGAARYVQKQPSLLAEAEWEINVAMPTAEAFLEERLGRRLTPKRIPR